jgi:hypothetical protein
MTGGHGSCETSAWLVIDDILVSRADSRAVSAEYRLDPRDVRELRSSG